MMPHAIRRVYVARRARSAASLAIWLVGVATLVCALSPKLTAYVTKGMPGINPALLSTLVMAMWVLGIVAYFIARARCEHHFQVALSKTVLPSENPDEDVERLSHEHPDDVARGMAHRLEVRSSAWPIAAAAMVVPMTALYVYYGYKVHGWPAIADYEQSLAANAGTLTFLAVAGAFAALVTTHRALRKSSSLVWLMSAGTVSLRKERAMLETDDPAAGSELFTWRAFIANVVSTLEAIGQRLNKRQGRIALVAGVAAVATLGFMTGRRTHTTAAKPAPAAAQVMPQQLVVNHETGSSYRVSSTRVNEFAIDIKLTDDKPLTIHFPGIAMIPSGWKAGVALRTDSTPALEATMFGDSRILSETAISIEGVSCGLEGQELEMTVRGEPGVYTVYAMPVLSPGACQLYRN